MISQRMTTQFIFFSRSEIICFCSRIFLIISFIFYSKFSLAYFSLYSCSEIIAYNFYLAYSSNFISISERFLLAYCSMSFFISVRFLIAYSSNFISISERFLFVSYLTYVNFCYS